jgi:hypothetical protein
MLSRKAKHLALAAQNRIRSSARFSPACPATARFAEMRGGQAALHFAQNDKLSYVLVNKRITVIVAMKSLSLSYTLSSSPIAVKTKMLLVNWDGGHSQS